MSAKRILIIDELTEERHRLTQFFEARGFEIRAEDTCEALGQLTGHSADALVLGLPASGDGENQVPGMLRHWKARHPSVPLLAIVPAGNSHLALNTLKQGADDYLTRPINYDELLVLIQKCIEARAKDQTIALLSERLDKRYGFDKLICHSSVMLDLLEAARRIAVSDSPVLLVGEEGTGKRLAAEAIHQNSTRKRGPFVSFNVGSLPEVMLEEDLFGVAAVRPGGSARPVATTRPSRLEAADGGTILLSHIDLLPYDGQRRLESLLKQHPTIFLRGTFHKAIDVRVIAATTVDLEQAVNSGKFRSELLARLQTLRLELPPLRKRREDIPLLLADFMERASPTPSGKAYRLSRELRDALESYDWPGNVRQLKNCVESMLAISKNDELTIDLLPSDIAGDHERNQITIPPGTKLQDLERKAVEQTLQRLKGNRTHTAAALGISVRTLQRKLKAWGLHDPKTHAPSC